MSTKHNLQPDGPPCTEKECWTAPHIPITTGTETLRAVVVAAEDNQEGPVTSDQINL